MKQEKKPQDAVYEITIPTHGLPVNRLDTKYLVDHGHVKSDSSQSIKSVIGWVKGAKADRIASDAHGGSVPAVSIQFCLFAGPPAALMVASAVEMGSANYPAHLEGKIEKDSASVHGVVLHVNGVTTGDISNDLVTVRRL